jgi:outer membrane murein-binding lipoprotein Lpp
VEAVLAAVISGGLSLAGVVITCLATSKKNETTVKVAQAVTDTKIDELTREVRLHNGFAERIPVMEHQIKTLTNEVKELKGYHKPEM